ncbi:hypothetical protein [Tenuifilum thalassicum]|uniref:Uncharacterized protein n=1 Tax=Tenuifilum thalassicum TaxID=2590900 RepID=A0A7D4C7C4_9BACT|nr:hypothetical protein [Tenuifilum thalassicum]QKG78922.1 hypothetical protein FHG85_01110 [Tenuifilum thalassicum]
MRKKLLFTPLILGLVLAMLNWGCEKDENDVCQLFEPPECEIANVCCPTDGGDCYYEVGDQKFVCDKTKATENDPDGCADAESQAIEVLCGTASTQGKMYAKAELQRLTAQLLQQAKMYSVCH